VHGYYNITAIIIIYYGFNYGLKGSASITVSEVGDRMANCCRIILTVQTLDDWTSGASLQSGYHIFTALDMSSGKRHGLCCNSLDVDCSWPGIHNKKSSYR